MRAEHSPIPSVISGSQLVLEAALLFGDISHQRLRVPGYESVEELELAGRVGTRLGDKFLNGKTEGYVFRGEVDLYTAGLAARIGALKGRSDLSGREKACLINSEALLNQVTPT